jgi:hypothetical protein
VSASSSPRSLARRAAQPEPDKADDFGWFPLDRLPHNMVPYVRSAIERWRAGAFYGESGWEPRRR